MTGVAWLQPRRVVGDDNGIHRTRAKSRVARATTTVAWST